MKKFIVGGIILLAVAAVVVVALANLNGIVNRNKEYIISRAEASIGRPVAVDEISVTLRGGIGVRLTGVTLADDPAFSQQQFLEAGALQVNAKLWPLLRKRFEVKRAVLHAPVIRIIRNEDGVMNFSSMAGDPAKESAGGREEVEVSPLVIALIDLDDGTITYEDRVTKTSITVTKVDTRIENLDWAKPLALELKAAFLSDEQNISVTGRTGALEQPVAFEAVPLECSITIDALDVTALKTALPQLAATIPPAVRIEGSLSADIQAEGTLPELVLTGTLDGGALALEHSGRFVKAADVPLKIEFALHRNGDETVIDRADVTLASTAFSGTGSVRGGTEPAFTLKTAGTGIDLAAVSQLIPAAAKYRLGGTADLDLQITGTARPGALPDLRGRVVVQGGSAAVEQLVQPLSEIDATVAFEGTRASISGARATLGSSRLTVDAEIESFQPLNLSYTVRSAEIALEDIRPPNPAARMPERLEDTGISGTMQVTDGAAVNRGSVTAEAGTIADIAFTQLAGDFVLDGTRAALNRISCNTLGGTLTGSGTADLDASEPRFEIDSRIEGAKISQLLGVVPALKKNPLTGTVNLNATISGTGREWDTIKKSINGNGLTQIFQGKILQFNIIDQLFSSLDQFPGLSDIVTPRIREKYPSAFKSGDTEFERWNSDFVVEDGKLKARNLVLSAADYTLRGEGFIDFDKLLNLDVTLFLGPDLSTDLVGSAGILSYFVNAQGQLEVPLRVRGTLPSVSVQPNQEYIQQKVQQGLLQQGVDQLKKKSLKDLLPKIKKRN